MQRVCLIGMSMVIASGLCGCKKSEEPPVSPGPATPTASAPTAQERPASEARLVSDEYVEAACAGCVFHMEGAEGCQLAIELDGEHYMVSDADVDAHSAGLCGGSKTALVSGRVVDGRFVATTFELEPEVSSDEP